MAEGEATVDVPGAGPIKKQWIIVGGAVVVGILAYAYWRRRGTADEAPPDPALGEPVTGPTTAGITFPPREEPDPSKLPPTTNAEWTRRAVAYLAQELGYDRQAVASALGKYLDRQPVNSAEADIIRAAIGAIGPPPQGEYRIIMIGTPTTPTPPAPPPPPPAPPAPPAPAPPPPAPAPPPVVTYTVRSGDNLWNIENRYGKPHGSLYAANAATIEAAARAHGKSSSRGGPRNEPGWWIYPGTVLRIP